MSFANITKHPPSLSKHVTYLFAGTILLLGVISAVASLSNWLTG